MARNGCTACLKKPREIERLTEALQRLRQKLRYQERPAAEGFVGAATPSAKQPVKATTPPAQALKRQGAQPGHPGVGRQAFDARPAERVVDLAPIVGSRGPDGDVLVEDQGRDRRAVIESHPGQAERVRYGWPKRYGPRGRRTFPPRAPAVLPQSL
jgi:hypothetical protein